ncbi:MAG: HAD-IA family hydrolase [Planctomycetes bacterium]|nr:HAD-IA family hydrolase [Planctomycetota bacterium]
MLKAVTFDAGETLVRPRGSYGAVYERVTATFGMRIPARIFDEEIPRAFRALEWPLRTSPEIERRRWEEVTRKVHEALPADLPFKEWFEAVYQAFAEPAVWEPLPGAAETLRALRAMGLRTATISNWDERLTGVLDGLALAPLLDATFIAPDVGWRKPAKEIFLAACRALGAFPDETLHVGDSPAEDVTGARAAGLHAVLFRPSDPTALRHLSHLLHSAPLVMHTGALPRE